MPGTMHGCWEDDFDRYWALILSLLAVHFTAISRLPNRYQPFAEPLLAVRRTAISSSARHYWRL